MATADGHEKGELRPSHRYPTRWSLRCHPASLPLAPKLEDEAENQVLFACKRRKEESSHGFSLPREIIFDILVRIPAAVLYEVVRYVCKQWYDVVRDPLFVKAHHQMSSPGFLIQDLEEIFQPYYYIEADADADTTRLKVTKLEIPFRAKILGSFNGLVLLHYLTTPQVLHVMNLVTKEKFSLPPLVGLDRYYQKACCALSPVGHYKVVHVSGEHCSAQLQMRVFTMGVDKAWRFIDLQLQGVPMKEQVKYTLLYRPLSIAGFLYWYSTFHHCGFALDVDTETIYQFSKPEDLCLHGPFADVLSLETCLGLIQLDTWRLWKLTDVKSGKWTEMAVLNMKAPLSRVDKMFFPSRCLVFLPVCLINGVFWFYRRVDEGFIVVRYNLIDGIFMFSPIKGVYEDSLLHSHVHTLLSPKNCYP